MNAPKPGDRISEYVLIEPVGAGTFGQVWKARHHVWKDQIVAVKVPTDAQYVRNLQKEGCTVHGLQHQNVVRAIGLDPYADVPYFVMEFVDGPSLAQLIAAHPKGLPIVTVQQVFTGILWALEHAHGHGVVHGDLKPANILVVGKPSAPVEQIRASDVKVTDFGLGHAGQVTTASILQSASLREDDGHGISGTIAYMAPEQRDGDQTDARSDLYSLGIILFEMITGERPSGSDVPSELRRDLPTWLDGLFSRLHTRLERRFHSAREALNALNSQASSAAPAYPAPPLPPIPRGARSVPSPACPACGAEIEDDDNFCIVCGAQVNPHPRRCIGCGGFASAEDRFCTLCGKPLGAPVG